MDSNGTSLIEQLELATSIPTRTSSTDRITWLPALPIVSTVPENVTLVSDEHSENALL